MCCQIGRLDLRRGRQDVTVLKCLALRGNINGCYRRHAQDREAIWEETGAECSWHQDQSQQQYRGDDRSYRPDGKSLTPLLYGFLSDTRAMPIGLDTIC